MIRHLGVLWRHRGQLVVMRIGAIFAIIRILLETGGEEVAESGEGSSEEGKAC